MESTEVNPPFPRVSGSRGFLPGLGEDISPPQSPARAGVRAPTLSFIIVQSWSNASSPATMELTMEPNLEQLDIALGWLCIGLAALFNRASLE